MKDKLLKIFDIYSKRKAGYIPLDDREELVEEIEKAFLQTYPYSIRENNVDWASLDPVKWFGVKPSRKYIIFGDTEDITITP